MASLQVRGADFSVTKQKALEDAKKMQKAVEEASTRSGKPVPQYQLSELIGKGSFGRVYKAVSLTTKKLVAVKIIDIEESDTINPKLADTYSDLLKEISALQMLSDSGAKNINHVIDALPVGQSMWMITEYCAGGSVSTLMRPTAPGGLQEKWIIPILREVAEAMFWVHGQGIIHRDLKCANVLVTEVGYVQLCDFGVAGVIETKFDKRTTVIGTPHWMAPELFDPTASYGTEVDIWAYGAMVYEIASGLPPNVTAGIDFSRLGNHLKHNTPRLEGDQYSAGLRDLVAFCLQHEPHKRPLIEQIKRHRYILKTEDAYSTASLSHLVRAFKLWEAQGGDRRSLFSAGGAQAPSDISSFAFPGDDWNFSTTAAFDQQVLNSGDAQDVYDVYGSNVDFDELEFEQTSKPKKPKSRRRPPPQLPSVKAPLEKIFDPNTMSSYDDNSRAYYGRLFPPPASDLPLRDDAAPATDVRESLIDLDASLNGSELSSFVDLNTIRAAPSRPSNDYNNFDDYSNSPTFSDSGGDDMNPNRRTRDWKFPTMPAHQPSQSENPRMPFLDDPTGSGFVRPPLLHHPTEPILSSSGFSDLATSQPDLADNRASMGSLIDLDMSFVDSHEPDYTRPSTSHSDAGSVTGSEMSAVNPFELEKHASLYIPQQNISTREPSIYVSDDSSFSQSFTGLAINGDAPAPDTFHDLTIQPHSNELRPYSMSDFADMDPEFTPQQTPAVNPPEPMTAFPGPMDPSSFSRRQSAQSEKKWRDSSESARSLLPPQPTAPSAPTMSGQASSSDVKAELHRLAMSLGDHLDYASTYLAGIPVRRGSMARLDAVADPVSAVI